MSKNVDSKVVRIVSGEPGTDDLEFEKSIRPTRFEDFIGQENVKRNLEIYTKAAKQRGEPIDHILFSGPPGLGKTTLAHIVANVMGTNLRATSGPVLEKARDLAGILTNLKYGDILFIDEIHRMTSVVEEYLYSAMEDFSIDLLIDQGPNARSIKINLPRFTLIGATTREGLLTGPFRARFGVFEKLDFYTEEDLKKIVIRSAGILKVDIDEEAAMEIAKRSRGTPRIANRFVRRIRDLAQVEGGGKISVDIARKGLKMLGVDEFGLDKMDRKILEVLLEHKGRPIGLKTIAVSVGEEEDTIEEVYEPFLIQQGFLIKTPRGRIPGEKAYKIFGKEIEESLF